MNSDIYIKAAGVWLKVLTVAPPASISDEIKVVADVEMRYFFALVKANKKTVELKVNDTVDLYAVEFNNAPRLEAGLIAHCSLKITKAVG